MRWTIYWSEQAESELNAIVSNYPDPALVAVASAAVAKELAGDPAEAEESRSEMTRVLCTLPLVVYFVLHPVKKAVQVTHVRAVWKRHQR